VSVDLAEVHVKSIPIRVVTEESARPQDRLSILSIEPSQVILEGTLEMLSKISEVITDRIRVDQLTKFNESDVVDVNVPLQPIRSVGLKPLPVKRVVVRFSKRH
jgi:YbbR domain-containing protein